MTTALNERYTDIIDFDGGGQGSIYLANDTLLDRTVAIKTFNTSEQDLKKEISYYRDIHSQHVAEIYEISKFNDNGNLKPCIIQEFIDGPNLSPIKKDTTDAPKSFLLSCFQIISGIKDIHDKNYVHRDLKPQNIKVDAEGVIKILDPGLSNNLNEADHTQIARGTMGFAAPELYVSNDPVPIHKPLDIYSFGAICWWMATGSLHDSLIDTPPLKNPFPGFESITDLDIPDAIHTILNRCLSSNKDDRPLASEIKEAIKEELIFGQHRAELIANGKVYSVSETGKKIKISNGPLGSLVIAYDGKNFIAETADQFAYLNNSKVEGGEVIPDSCVITIGPASAGWQRLFASFNISYPGVIF